MDYFVKGCCSKPIPAVYDDTLTYYEDFCRLVDKLNEVIKVLNEHGEDISALETLVNELIELLEEWTSGEFEDVIKDEVLKWVEDNVKLIFETYCKQAFFGLTSDGYFCAYIPQSWSEIVFDTGAVYGSESYGRLILKYIVDGQGVINNTNY